MEFFDENELKIIKPLIDAKTSATYGENPILRKICEYCGESNFKTKWFLNRHKLSCKLNSENKKEIEK